MAQPAHLEGLVETSKGATEALNNALFTVSQLADLVGSLNNHRCASRPGNSSASTTIHVEFLTEARKDAMDALNNALVTASRIADLVSSLNRQIMTTRCVCQLADTVTGIPTIQLSTTSDGTAVVALHEESEGQTAKSHDLADVSASGDKPPAEHDTLAADESAPTSIQSQRDVTVVVKEETEYVDVEERPTPTASPRKLAENSAPTRQTQMCEKFIQLLRDQPTVELMVLQGLEDLSRAEKVKRKPGRPGRKRRGADKVLGVEGYREKMIEKRRERARRYYIERRDRVMRERLENRRSLRQRRSCTARVTTYSELAEKPEVQVKKEVYI